MGATAKQNYWDMPSNELADGVSHVLDASRKAAAEWNKKYERLGDSVEESFRARGYRIVSRQMGLIHAEVEGEPGRSIFIHESGYERWLRDIPPLRKSLWHLLLEHNHWMDAAWSPLPLPYALLQSFEGTEMPLSQQDIDRIVAAQAQANQGFTPAWKQTATICATIALFAIGSVSWWTTRLDRLEDKADARMTKMEETLQGHGKILERLDERTQRATSTDTHSSTLPKATDGSPKP